MASFIPLPNEILAKIFSDECLSDIDLSKTVQACKLFREVVQEYPGRKLTFIVDAPSLIGWRFVRCLLRNPEIGEYFREIKLEWDRRAYGLPEDEDRWTDTWNWTEQEKEQISTFCAKWDINEKTTSLILEGRNSEPLLPLILCLTPKLKSLDMGDVDPQIMNIRDNCTSRDQRRSAREYLIYKFGPKDPFSPDRYPFQDISGARNRIQEEYGTILKMHRPRDHSIFFFDNLQYRVGGGEVKPKSLSPGLASLEYFSIGCSKTRKDVYGGKNHVPGFLPVLLLPRIETIEIVENIHKDLVPTYFGYHPFDTQELYNDGLSTAKRLTIRLMLANHDEQHDKDAFIRFFTKISRIAANLEYVHIHTQHPHRYAETSALDEEVTKIFLQNSRNLDPKNILVNGGSFDETGKFFADEGRRRAVARKQRLYQLAQGKRVLKPPPPIVTHSRTLVPGILKYLLRKDVFSLMLSCKALHEICHPYLWSGFHFTTVDACLNSDNVFRHTIPSFRYKHLIDSIQRQDGGVLEHLEWLGFNLTFYVYGVTKYAKQLLSTLSDQIQLGNTPKLKYLHISWGDMLSNPVPYLGCSWLFDDPENIRLHHTIKAYAESRPLEDFTISLEVSIDTLLTEAPSLLDLSKLKTLVLSLSRHLPEEQINSSTDLFAHAPNLENLTLENNMSFGELEDAFPGLQHAVSGLKRLESLSIGDRYHSLLLALIVPPPSCKTVSYQGRATSTWWEKFAKEPFPNVERMILNCEEISESCIESKSGGELTPINKMMLGDIGVSGLKWLSVNPWGYSNKDIAFKGYPPDFVPRMVKQNRNLSKECLKQLSSQLAESYIEGRETSI
ncbi:hypothetical protein TWF730_010019 [Orbilia blumenaviensis]|uniref:F-box domain-containing protein n=1 Tax=Orbilia blumenaviensis TaxID=1796055 RepID=A0AAV9UUG4_9PEZI